MGNSIKKMEIDKLTDNRLFERHSKPTVKEWLRQLDYFYFIRAWGGHANDGDAFKVEFVYSDRLDLINKLGQIGITLNIIPDDFPRPIIGQSYPSAEFEKFKTEIKNQKNLEQPSHSIIFGHKAFIWVSANTFRIEIAGTKDNNLYEVTEEDFQVCIGLEKQFQKLGWHQLVDKTIEQNICCISKTKYPELFGEETTAHNIG